MRASASIGIVPAGAGLPVPSTGRAHASASTQAVAPASSTKWPAVRLTKSEKAVYVLWFIILCDPQWWIASYGPRFILQLPTVLFGVFAIATLMKAPRYWYLPLAAVMAYTAIMVPLAYNSGYAMKPTKALIIYYILLVGTYVYVRTPRQALPLVLLFFLWQHMWWVVLGAAKGRVPWHPSNANYDGFGPQMVLALPSCYYIAMAVKDRKLKWIGWAGAAGSVIGLVSSFARGAVLAGAAVLVFMWWRSPRKGAATMVVVVGALMTVLAANVFFSSESRSEEGLSFWGEMGTVFSESEGDYGTTKDREVLWALARRVYFQNPVLGVGANNFGPYAAEHFEAGDVGGKYDENPGRLYDRALHSSYYQVLAEYGTVGSALMIFLLFDFWRRNRQLRKQAYRRYWASATGGTVDLRYLSLALEGSMVGFLTSGLFYNQLFVGWLWTILGMNVLLHRLARPVEASAAEHRLARSNARTG